MPSGKKATPATASARTLEVQLRDGLGGRAARCLCTVAGVAASKADVPIFSRTNLMALKKSELYSSLWQSCDELRGGMDAS